MKLRKITAAQYNGWRSNRPSLPDRMRPAQVLSRRLITQGSQMREPIYEAQCRCDDNKVRTFVSGPEGRWIRKGAKPCQ